MAVPGIRAINVFGLASCVPMIFNEENRPKITLDPGKMWRCVELRPANS